MLNTCDILKTESTVLPVCVSQSVVLVLVSCFGYKESSLRLIHEHSVDIMSDASNSRVTHPLLRLRPNAICSGRTLRWTRLVWVSLGGGKIGFIPFELSVNSLTWHTINNSRTTDNPRHGEWNVETHRNMFLNHVQSNPVEPNPCFNFVDSYVLLLWNC